MNLKCSLLSDNPAVTKISLPSGEYLIAFEIGDTQKEDLFYLASKCLTNYNIECIIIKTTTEVN